MNIDFKEITLSNYDGIKLKADIDENPDDIIAAVLYSDHGDSFLAVKTKEGIFEYGWWLDRPGYSYDLLDKNTWRNRDEFIKLPKLYGKLDKGSYVSNEIYSLLRRWLYTDGKESSYGFGNFLKENLSPDTAQMYFNFVYDDLEECYNKNVVYRERADRLSQIKCFLSHNDILTEENLKKLEDIKTFLRIGAIDGAAGKQKGDQSIGGDNLDWIWYGGKQVTKKYHKHGIKVKGYTEYDEFGDYHRFYIDMDQFKEADC